MAHVEFDPNTGWLKVTAGNDFAACPLSYEEAVSLASVLLQFGTSAQRASFKRLKEEDR